jgi:hypothetical protein
MRAIFGAGAILQLAGCAGNDQDTTRVQGVAAGAAVGAGVGQLLGGNSRSTLVGAVIGGALGLAAGDAVARRKAGYASTEVMITAETERLGEQAEALSTYNAGLRDHLRTMDREIAALEAKREAGSADRDAALEIKEQAADQLARAEDRLAEVEQEVEISHGLLADARDEREATELALWERHLEGLEQERDQLVLLIGNFQTRTEKIS